MSTEEPRIHSNLTDVLPDDYKGLNDKVAPDKSIDCDCCGEMVHAFNNECMQTWIETETGNYCTTCLKLPEVLEGDANNDWPLKNDLTPRKSQVVDKCKAPCLEFEYDKHTEENEFGRILFYKTDGTIVAEARHATKKG